MERLVLMAARLREHPANRLRLNVGANVAVASPLFLGRVRYPLVQNALIDALGGTSGDEAVAEEVKALHDTPLRSDERALEVVVGLIARDWLGSGFLCPNPVNGLMSEEERAAGMFCQPGFEDILKEWCHRHAPGRALRSNAFSFTDGDRSRPEVDVRS